MPLLTDALYFIAALVVLGLISLLFSGSPVYAQCICGHEVRGTLPLAGAASGIRAG
jgi:hypothetical protein